MTFITRFAPSPTGPLHLGHAYSAIYAADLARRHAGKFLLRIEDIDQSRSRDSWTEQIYSDLSWLGLSWPTPVWVQSHQIARYHTALQSLWDKGLLYECTCNRRDIMAALSAPQEGAPLGPDGVIYPGTCRAKYPRSGPINTRAVLRLDAKAALAQLRSPLKFYEAGSGPNQETGEQTLSSADFIGGIGDVVLARKDMETSYHVSVVVDDAAQGITDVTRGQDLFDATMIHVLLQNLLSLPVPVYHHHRLIRDDQGKRLAKRDNARALTKLRAEGATPSDIRQLVGLD